MFNIGTDEFILVGVVALVVIGPKDLPRAMRVVGHWVGKARAVTRHFRAGLDEMVRQSELEEMERKWAAENARIMASHPASDAELNAPEAAPVTPSSLPPVEVAAASSAPPASAAPSEQVAPAPVRRKKAAPAKAAPDAPGDGALPLFGPDDKAAG